MTERAHFPSSPACGQWETLLADALDGLLLPEDEATFNGHMAGCSACSALFEEAQRGREWLGFLTAEPEAPAGLVDRILAHTGPGHKDAQPAFAGDVLPGSMAAWQEPGLMGQVRRWAEPRLIMTMAMAFFSIALTMNLAGIRLTNMRLSELRPTSIRSYMERRITMASVPFVRYYDHLRFVYEVQTTVRELRNQSNESAPERQTPPAATPQSEQQKKDGGSRINQPQQSVQPLADPDMIETSLPIDTNDRAFRRLQNVMLRATGRSEVWTA